MILVIDDCPRRIKGFRRALGTGIQVAMTRSAAAGKLCRNRPYTAIYLDCDGVDGVYLAGLIAERGYHRDAKIYIHSSNYAGAIKMRDILKDTHDVELVSYDEIAGQ